MQKKRNISGTPFVAKKSGEGTMDRRAKGVWAHRGPDCSADVVMVCRESSEIRQVSDILSELGSGTLAVYDKVEDLAMNAPRAMVSLAIIAGDMPKELLEHSLRWLKRWRPSTACAVIADPGRTDLEIAARSGGAGYFIRPVATEQWQALLLHAVERSTAQGSAIESELAPKKSE